MKRVNESLQVQWLLHLDERDSYIAISDDTETVEPFKYRIDKPATNTWRLRIHNLQLTDQGQYICRVQTGPLKSVNDSKIISVRQEPVLVQ